MLLNSRRSLDLLTLSRTALLIAANLFFADRAAAQGVIGWGVNDVGQRNIPPAPATISVVSAGATWTATLRIDGSVACFGTNDLGQCNVPIGLSGVTAISAGAYHCAALKQDGTVVCWGNNGDGQCNVPSGLSGVTAVSAGPWNSMAVKNDGTVRDWGYLSDPMPPNLANVVAVSAGAYHRVALRDDGTVACWTANNDLGQCNVPIGLSGVTAISAGTYHCVALKQDGTVVCWGNNGNGQCNVPSGLSGVTAVSAGGFHCVARKNDGSVICWGANTFGQCSIPTNLGPVSACSAGYSHTVGLRTVGTVAGWGDNTAGACNVTSGLAPVRTMAMGLDHTVALQYDATIACWGANTYGQCNVPAGLLDVRAVGAGAKHSVVAKGNGAVVCWGDNTNGQCTVPIGLLSVADVAAGGNHTVVRYTNGGGVRCWGLNSFGQCSVPSTLSGTLAIAAGGLHTVALRTDRTVQCWGHNVNGQSSVPTGLAGVGAVAAGEYHTVVSRTDGTVVCWGSNSSGQCSVPSGLTGVTAVAAGVGHTVVSRTGGTVVCWGLNAYGQCTVPSGVGTVRAVFAGKSTTIAIYCIPDVQGEPDCDNDTTSDRCEIVQGSTDCNLNLIPDECDIASGQSSDFNADGILDSCQNEIVGVGESIQAAIEIASTGTILVGPGTYAPIDFKGKAITIRSIGGAAVTTLQGTTAGTVVRFSTNEGIGSVLDGFTIKGGGGFVSGSARVGGGVYISSASPTIKNCIIEQNTANLGTGLGLGGGIYVLNGVPVIEGCGIQSNAAKDGGGIWFEVSNSTPLAPIMRDTLIAFNTASGRGGGVALSGEARPQITNCDIRSNIASSTGKGGGISVPAATNSAAFSLASLMSTVGCLNTPDGINGPVEDLGGNSVSSDCNANGLCDADEIAANVALDTDSNGVLDGCEDCDGDGVPNGTEILAGAIDCDGNGVPDSCEIGTNAALDADADGYLDACEMAVESDGWLSTIGAGAGLVNLGESMGGAPGILVAAAPLTDTAGLSGSALTQIDSGAALVFEKSLAGEWRQVARLRPREIAPHDQFGSARVNNSIAVSANRIAIGWGRDDRAAIEDCGAIAIFDRNASGVWVEQPAIRQSVLTANRELGHTVAFAGSRVVSMTTTGTLSIFSQGTDSNWTASSIAGMGSEYSAIAGRSDYITVGLPYDDTGGLIDSGAVKVIKLTGSTWSLFKTERHLTPTAGDNFGWAMAMQVFSNQTRYWTSSPQRSVDGLPGRGNILVGFASNSTVSTPLEYGVADHASYDQLGRTIAVINDPAAQLPNALLAVGAEYDDGASIDRGAVTLVGTSFNFYPEVRRKLVAAAPQTTLRFGAGLAFAGTELVVAAPGWDISAEVNRGKVLFALPLSNDCDADNRPDLAEIYDDRRLDLDRNELLDACEIVADSTLDTNTNGILDRCEASNAEHVTTKSLTLSSSGLAGVSVCVAGDAKRIIVGVPGESREGVANRGAVYIWQRLVDLSWQLEAVFVQSDGMPADGFGSAVGLSGVGTYASVGAPTDDANGTDSGSAWGFQRLTTGLRTQWETHSYARMLPSDIGASDKFGAAVLISAGISGSTLNVGAPGESAAYRFTHDYAPTPVVSNFKLTAAGATGIQFGGMISPIYGGIAVGATLADNGAIVDTGAVYLFSSGGTSTGALFAPDGVSGDAFGASCAMSRYGTSSDVAVANVLVIGAPMADSVGADSGAIYVWESVPGVLTYRQRLVPTELAAGDRLGSSLSVWGPLFARTTIYAGAPRRNVGAITDAGAVFIFTPETATTFGFHSMLTQPILGASNRFGEALHLSDETLIVGAPYTDVGGFADAGAAELFRLDCDGDGFNDFYRTLAGQVPDCNLNRVPDSCEIASGASTDLNQNNIPDECDSDVVGGSGNQSIQTAINSAPAGGVIKVYAGTYQGPVDFSGKAVTLRGMGGAANTRIEGTNASSVVLFRNGEANTSVIEGFTISKGGGTTIGLEKLGGGVFIQGASPILRDCVITQNDIIGALGKGGGIAIISGSPRIERVTIRDNSASDGGGVFMNTVGTAIQTPTFIDSTIDFNSATYSGGGLMLQGASEPTLDAVRVSQNAALSTAGSGGGMRVATSGESAPSLFDTVFCLNTPDEIVGGYSDGGGNAVTGDCNENGLCDADEIAAGVVQDCDANGIPDTCEPIVVRASPSSSPFWAGAPLVFQRADLPNAVSAVSIFVLAKSDLSALDEYVTVRINGVVVGTVFVAGATDCAVAGNAASLLIPAATFNGLLIAGSATIRLEPSATVGNTCAGGTWAQVTVSYIGEQADCDENGTEDICQIASDPLGYDCNGNAILDACDIATGNSFDANENGVPDECESGCTVDTDGDGTPDCEDGCPTIAGLTAPVTYWVDADSDGFGSLISASFCALAPPVGYAANNLDCSDAIATIFPGAPELCATIGIDNDCDGDLNDATDLSTFFADADGDGAGDPNVSVVGCVAPPGYVANAADGCPNDPSKISAGVCGCGVPDTDTDSDGFADCTDNCDSVSNPTQSDCNGDGVGDACELASGAADCNGNGRPDACDIAAGSSSDLDANSVPDDCEFVVGGSGYSNIQAAVNAAPVGTTIRVGAGVWSGIPVVISKQLTLRSIHGALTTTLDGTGLSTSIIQVAGPISQLVTIDGFTMENGTVGTLWNGSVRVGGAVAIFNARAEIHNCVFRTNGSEYGGAVYGIGYAGLIANCGFDSNQASVDGGALLLGLGSTWEVRACIFAGNSAVLGGGAHVWNVDGRFINCAFDSNNASDAGGAVSWFSDGGLPLLFFDCAFDANIAAIGGGAARVGGTQLFHIGNSTFCANEPEAVDGDFLNLGGNIFGLDCDGDGVCEAVEGEASAESDCDENGIDDLCDILDDPSRDVDGDGRLDACERSRGDLNLDGIVNAIDLAILLVNWDSVPPALGDITGDGLINAADLSALLTAWGSDLP